MFIRCKVNKAGLKVLKLFFILTIIAELVFPKRAFSDSLRDYSEEPIPVRLKTGSITEVEFAAKIANVTKGVPSEFLQIETLGNRMFLLPRQSLSADVFVVTQDNVSYCLRLSADETEGQSRLRIGKPQDRTFNPKAKEIINTVNLMKTLMLGEQPKGSASLELYKYEIFNNGTLRMVVNQVYQLPGGVRAFVLTLENLRDKPVTIPIEHIELPGLLAISADNQILEARPKGKEAKASGYTTKAYMVVEGVNQ